MQSDLRFDSPYINVGAPSDFYFLEFFGLITSQSGVIALGRVSFEYYDKFAFFELRSPRLDSNGICKNRRGISYQKKPSLILYESATVD